MGHRKYSHLIAVVSDLVSEVAGIQLGANQRAMVASRMSKRLLELGLDELGYLQYLYQHQVDETQELVSLLTTHHTYFFREFAHFEYLEKELLPKLVSKVQACAGRRLRIWSAACSRGQEVYSLAMCVSRFLDENQLDLDFEIWGTDIDGRSIECAQNGVYLRDEIKEVPMAYLKNHWARGTGEIEKYVKVKNSLKRHCIFRKENVFDLSADFKRSNFDIIFCRNLFIYFDASQVSKLATDMLGRLSEEGALFVGISESLRGLSVPAQSLGPSIYRKKQADLTAQKSGPFAQSKPPLLRVLCVDDSPTILALLKRILTEKEGFEVVGQAKNGLEASGLVAALRPDLVTLDIHMPEQDGLSYLRENFGLGHPPVIMVSSVSRDEAHLAHEAFNLGASDYIEKPSLNNLEAKTSELCSKLKSAHLNFRSSPKGVHTLDREFSKISSVDGSRDVGICLFFSMSSRDRVADYFSGRKVNSALTLLVMDGVGDSEEIIRSRLSSDLGVPIQIFKGGLIPSSGVHLIDSQILNKDWKRIAEGRQAWYGLLLGEVTPTTSSLLGSWQAMAVVIEDIKPEVTQRIQSAIGRSALDVVPVTSFDYVIQSQMASRIQGKRAA